MDNNSYQNDNTLRDTLGPYDFEDSCEEDLEDPEFSTYFSDQRVEIPESDGNVNKYLLNF
jgi:hypothetical protein